MNYNLHLNYEGFEKWLLGYGAKLDGVQYMFRFENDYGASIVKFTGSFGHRSDYWELAVIKFNVDGDFTLLYDTPIADDVIGHLTDAEVCELLGKIKDLA